MLLLWSRQVGRADGTVGPGMRVGGGWKTVSVPFVFQLFHWNCSGRSLASPGMSPKDG